MIRKQLGDVEWLEFELFSGIPELIHGVFLRHGGVSQGPYNSLNAGGGSKDHGEHVKQNLEIIREVMGLPNIISGHQCHGVDIAYLPEFPPSKEGCDGLITQEKNLGLRIKHADCQAAIFYDPVKKAIANIHCGWRGNVKNIYAETIAKLKKTFGSNPKDLLVGISPSLGPEASEFKNYLVELPESFYKYQIKPTYFNLWEISRQQLLEGGILPDHIQIASICTYANPQDYFSYRRDKVTGRHATIVALR